MGFPDSCRPEARPLEQVEPNHTTTRSLVAPSVAASNRLSGTRTMRDGGYQRWSQATLGIVGAGLLGSRLALDAVCSGVGSVRVFDFDTGQAENQATPYVRPGVPKVETLAAACEALRAGVVQGYPLDIRHAGLSHWRQCDVVVDCSDDASLAWSLTETANGTGTPLLRCAVEGSGQWELGRVLCSASRPGCACQLCSYSLEELGRGLERTPCPGAADELPPTIAGGAIASAIAAVALLQAQRLVTGNDLDQVLDREILLDLTHMQMHALRLPRSEQCLSGHVAWQPLTVASPGRGMTLRQLFQLAGRVHDDRPVMLCGYQHALNVQAYCSCGQVTASAGTDWAPPPRCTRCGKPTNWLKETQREGVYLDEAERLGIADRPLGDLGFPADGSLWLVRDQERPLWRLLLE